MHEHKNHPPGAVPKDAHLVAPRAPALAGMDRLAAVIAESPAPALLDPGTPAGAAFTQAVRDIVFRVRQIDPVHSERLIIALRAAWRMTPELRLLADDGLREALWNRLLTVCVETFYADTRAN